MKVQCVLCDQVEKIDPHSTLGKKLRNHPATTYMCALCADRIKINTEQRRIAGKLKKPTFHRIKDEW